MNSVTTERELGAAAYKNGDFELAIKHFTNAIDEKPESKETKLALHSNRSASFLLLKQYSNSIADAKKCIDIDATWKKGYARLGDAYFKNGQLNEALLAYTTGLKLDPSDSSLGDKCEQVKIALNHLDNEFSNHVPTMTGIKGILKIMQSCARYFMMANVLLFMCTYGSFGSASYRRAVATQLFVSILGLFLNHGIPKFNLKYAEKIITDMQSPKILLAGILLFSKSYFLAVMPLVFWETTEITPLIFKYAKANLPAVQSQLRNLIGRVYPQPQNQNLAALFTRSNMLNTNLQLFRLGATFEVMQGMYLIIELILPSRNLVFTMIWWQYLQMRYMTDPTNQVKYTFIVLDNYVSALLSHGSVPGIIRQGYNTLKSILLKRVTLPAAEQQQSAHDTSSSGAGGLMTKCTIM